MSELHEINLDTSVRQGYEGYSDFYELASDAIDRASDQGQRTATLEIIPNTANGTNRTTED